MKTWQFNKRERIEETTYRIRHGWLAKGGDEERWKYARKAEALLGVRKSLFQQGSEILLEKESQLKRKLHREREREKGGEDEGGDEERE